MKLGLKGHYGQGTAPQGSLSVSLGTSNVCETAQKNDGSFYYKQISLADSWEHWGKRMRWLVWGLMVEEEQQTGFWYGGAQ